MESDLDKVQDHKIDEDFLDLIIKNYRHMASVFLDYIGMKDKICSDEQCSTLDGTLLVLIHLLVVKYSTYGLLNLWLTQPMAFREKYGDQIKSSFLQNLV